MFIVNMARQGVGIMVKRLITFFISIFLVATLSISVAAISDLDNKVTLDTAISDKIGATENFLVTITRPDVEKENTFKKNSVIGGTSEVKDIIIVLAKYNDETGKYEEFESNDGDSRWTIGKSKFFAKEVLLDKGVNSFKLLAFKKSDMEKLFVGKNLQISYFKIVLLDESLKEKIINSVISIFNFKILDNKLGLEK
jgi:hypothetical protein